MESITGIDIDLGNVRKKSTLKRNAVSSLASSKGSFPSNIDEEFDLVDKQRKRAQNDSELFVSLDAALASTESPSKRSLPSQTAYNLQFPIVLARTFARLVDLLWEISIVWFVVRILLPVDTMSMLSKVLIIPCVLLPMALILDSLVQGLFGNTPGKKLLGIQAVTWRGRQLSLLESLERNFLVWRFGFLFGIVPLIPISAFREWILVFKGDRTRYDEHLHLRTKGFNRPIWLSVLAAAAAITLLSLPVSHFVYGQQLFSGAGFHIWRGIMRKHIDPPVSLITETPSHDAVNDRGGEPIIRSVLVPKIESDTKIDLLSDLTKLPSSVALSSVKPVSIPLLASTSSPMTLGGVGPVLLPTAYSTILPGEVTIPLLSEASALSIAIDLDTSVGTDATQRWTNPYSGLSTEIDAEWKNEIETRDKSSRSIVFRHISTESILTLNRVGSTALTFNELAEQFVALRANYALTVQRGRMTVGDFPGWAVVAEPDSAGTVRRSEWVKIDNVVYRMELIAQPVAQQSVERLQAIVWSTFI